MAPLFLTSRQIFQTFRKEAKNGWGDFAWKPQSSLWLNLGSGGGLEEACLLMETAVPGLNPSIDWKFSRFQSSHRFFQLQSLQLLPLGVGILFSYCLYLFPYSLTSSLPLCPLECFCKPHKFNKWSLFSVSLHNHSYLFWDPSIRAKLVLLVFGGARKKITMSQLVNES